MLFDVFPLLPLALLLSLEDDFLPTEAREHMSTSSHREERKSARE